MAEEAVQIIHAKAIIFAALLQSSKEHITDDKRVEALIKLVNTVYHGLAATNR